MSASDIQHAAAVLRQGGIVAYPTEAVYGIGCDPRNLAALERLLRIKKRDPAKGLILIAAQFDQLSGFILPLTPDVSDRVLPTWPGPVTWVLPAQPDVPQLLRGTHDSLAVRVTAHSIAASLCAAFRGALVSTSANVSADPPARTADEVRSVFGSSIDYVLTGSVGPHSKPTEIRDGRTGKTLRSG